MIAFLHVTAIRDMVLSVHPFHPKRKAEKRVLKEKTFQILSPTRLFNAFCHSSDLALAGTNPAEASKLPLYPSLLV
jgi:hypothetical protein